MTGILAGLRIVEVSAFVAAPLAGATLASMGAEVIRVEQLGGGIDAARWPMHAGRSLYRAGLDQGKRSLTVDLRSASGQALVQDLICADGDSGGILISNLSASGWMAYPQLAARRPDLIMVHITGTPDGGAAVDYTVNASTGFPLITGPGGWEGPVNHALPAWDIATGLLATTAVLAAERHRRRTGEGQLVRLALSDVALAMSAHLGLLAEAKLDDVPRARLGNDIYGSYGRDFRTRDGRYVMVCALTARQWQSLVSATGTIDSITAIELEHGVDLRDEADRFRHRHAIHPLIEAWVATRTLAELHEAFDLHHVLWSPYQSFQELVQADPAAADPYATPLDFGAFAREKAAPAPTIGADTEQVLEASLHLDAATLAALREHQIIDPPAEVVSDGTD